MPYRHRMVFCMGPPLVSPEEYRQGAWALCMELAGLQAQAY